MATRKTVSKKKQASKSGKKVSKKAPASGKSSGKKSTAKKAAAKKPVSRKKASTKKTSSKKKSVSKKSGTTVSKKKTTTKKKSTKKAAKKTSAKKSTAKKASVKKKPAKQTAAKKSSTKAGAVKKQAASAKKKSTKKAATKTASKKKVTAKKAGKKVAAKSEAAATDKTPPVKRKIVIRTPPVKRPNRIMSHAPINPADHLPQRAAKRRKVSDDQLIHGIPPYIPKKGETYMNDAQLAHFRTILVAWRTELMEEVDRTVHHMQDEASNFPDPNDRATQESEFGLELRTRDRERKLLKKINQAIARVDDGSYGYCEETGEEIGLKRLEARPVATLCVEAQERREVAERQYRDQDDRYR